MQDMKGPENLGREVTAMIFDLFFDARVPESWCLRKPGLAAGRRTAEGGESGAAAANFLRK